MKAYLVGKLENDLQGIPCIGCPALRQFDVEVCDSYEGEVLILSLSSTNIGFFNLNKELAKFKLP